MELIRKQCGPLPQVKFIRHYVSFKNVFVVKSRDRKVVDVTKMTIASCGLVDFTHSDLQPQQDAILIRHDAWSRKADLGLYTNRPDQLRYLRAIHLIR